jgi:hypothetical protein
MDQDGRCRDTFSHAVVGAYARAHTKASLDPHVAVHLLFASCETRRAVGGRAVATDRIGALVYRERRSRC